MSFRIKNEIKKTDNNIQNIKESQTLDKKHKEIIKNFQCDKDKLLNYDYEIEEINSKVLQMDKYREKFSIEDLKTRALLLDEQEKLENLKKTLSENFNEMDYYDKIGDLVIQYYELRDDNKPQIKESRNIMEFLSGNKTVKTNNTDSNKAELFEKYWKRIEGVRINMDDGSKRIKYCEECNIEKILD